MASFTIHNLDTEVPDELSARAVDLIALCRCHLPLSLAKSGMRHTGFEITTHRSTADSFVAATWHRSRSL